MTILLLIITFYNYPGYTSVSQTIQFDTLTACQSKMKELSESIPKLSHFNDMHISCTQTK